MRFTKSQLPHLCSRSHLEAPTNPAAPGQNKKGEAKHSLPFFLRSARGFGLKVELQAQLHDPRIARAEDLAE